jgi:hypothetical protein
MGTKSCSVESSGAGCARPGGSLLLRMLGLVGMVIVIVSVGRAEASGRHGVDALMVESARLETDALRADLAAMARTGGAVLAGECGLHKRLIAFVEKYQKYELLEGAFAELVNDSSSANRGRDFIDPWNTPYWIRHLCGAGGSDPVIVVYSFGPNRQRESTDWEIGGDDVGAILVASGF